MPVFPPTSSLLDDKLDPVDLDKPAADDLELYSVTTIIGALDKPALVYWSAEQTALAAVKVCGSLYNRVAEEGQSAVVKWLRDARFRQPDGERTAADLGTAVHAAAEEYALTGIRPKCDDDVVPFLDQFDRWLQRAQPEYQAVETTVYNTTYGYAGTLDSIMTLQGVPLIADYKTSKKSKDGKGNDTTPYPEVGLQLAAYRYAEFAAMWRPRRYEKFRRRYYLLGEDERAMSVPVPPVEGGVCIHITPDHCEAYPVRCDEDIHTAFLFIEEAFRFVNETSKTVIGKPLVFEGE